MSYLKAGAGLVVGSIFTAGKLYLESAPTTSTNGDTERKCEPSQMFKNFRESAICFSIYLENWPGEGRPLTGGLVD